MIAELRDLAVAIAREAGDMAAAGRRSGNLAIETKSTATDVVTEWDRASEALIVRRIRESRPDDGIVGEEGTSTSGTSGVSWLVDPIDGTTNFLYDLPGWNVSIAALDATGAIAGAVYVPRFGELFSAGRGLGARLDDTCGTRVLSCSAASSLSTALVATGFSYQPERRTIQAQRVAKLMHEIRDIRRSGAAATDLCSVAAGRVDVYFEEWLGPWDLAAGELIAREAGCRSGDYSGAAVRPSEVLVASPGVFDAMSDLLQRAGAPFPGIM